MGKDAPYILDATKRDDTHLTLFYMPEKLA